jgi:hypothetical protein
MSELESFVAPAAPFGCECPGILALVSKADRTTVIRIIFPACADILCCQYGSHKHNHLYYL